jgi:hypothetical protein
MHLGLRTVLSVFAVELFFAACPFPSRAQQAVSLADTTAPPAITRDAIPAATAPQNDPAAAVNPQSGQSPTQAPAQSTPPSTTQQAPAQQTPAGKDKDKDNGAQNQNTQGKVPGTSNDRLFYTLPNFLSLNNNGKLPPLTAKEKFKVVALGSFDPVEYPWWGLIAAISQADNGDPAYGQGWAAYGKRYATTAADSTIENFMAGAVFPSVLHQDPRFYESSQGGFGRRTGYAISRIFVTRADSGRSQFNYSEVFGAAFAAAVSTYSYHPRSTYVGPPSHRQFIGSERTLTNAGSTWATQVGEDTVTYVIKEFWPDIKHKISRSKADMADSAGSRP